MKATSTANLEFRIHLEAKDIETLRKKGLLRGEVILSDDSRQKLKIHYAKTHQELVRIALKYQDCAQAGKKYDFYAVYIAEDSLKRIENREVSYFSEIYEPLYIRQGWISLEDVI